MKDIVTSKSCALGVRRHLGWKRARAKSNGRTWHCWDHQVMLESGSACPSLLWIWVSLQSREADQNSPVSFPRDGSAVNAVGMKEEGKQRLIPSCQTLPVSSNLWPRTSWVRGNVFILNKPWSFPSMNLSKLGEGNFGLDLSAWLETVIFARKVSNSLIFLENYRRGCRLQFNLVFKRENKVCKLQLQSNSSKAFCFLPEACDSLICQPSQTRLCIEVHYNLITCWCCNTKLI